jgi:hypothetical protein
LPELATSTLAAHGLSATGVVPHFIAGTRRTSKLIDRWQGMTSGGPINLLDLDRGRRTAAAAAAAHWLLWQQVVAGTKPAQPLWAYLDRHHTDPLRYPLDRAHAEYSAQPRILAMTAFNALPYRPVELPTAALEALQAGSNTYATLAWLSAVPADGLAPAHGGWLTASTDRLNDQLVYLQAANAYLASLPRDAQLVAVATPV